MTKTASAPAIEYAVGTHHPLGVSRDGKYINFSVSVPGASICTLKLKTSLGVKKIVMDSRYRFGSVFAVKVAGLPADFTYTYEALDKAFTDPYARGVRGREEFGIIPEETPEAYLPEERFDWKQDKHPGIVFEDLIIYKLHVRGFTMDESSGVKHKGSFQGILEKLPYIKKLGINAILLTPCVDFVECMEETHLPPNLTAEMQKVGNLHREKAKKPAKVNFWGYGAKGNFFAVKPAFASDKKNPDKEFKKLIKRLHSEGIEVLMELSFPESATTDYILDVCRFWVEEYHLDGYRFINLPIADYVIAADPYLADTKLIFTGWDEKRVYPNDEIPTFKHLAITDGAFEYNVRRYLKGDEGFVNSFTEIHRRNAHRVGCVNAITDNNGFTLKDLYTYDIKHNENNGESNRDGREVNYSWNCGKEGETNSKKILTRRQIMTYNALIAMFTAQGTPMLLAGDEFLNTQAGNNNAYCQDNPCGWLNWNKSKAQRELTAFIIKLIELRKNHMVFRNREPLKLMDYVSYGCPDLSYHGVKAWGPDFSYYSRAVGLLYNGAYARTRIGKLDDSFYLIFNMDSEAHTFDLPLVQRNKKWEMVLSSVANQNLPKPGESVERSLEVPARGAIILKEN